MPGRLEPPRLPGCRVGAGLWRTPSPSPPPTPEPGFLLPAAAFGQEWVLSLELSSQSGLGGGALCRSTRSSPALHPRMFREPPAQFLPLTRLLHLLYLASASFFFFQTLIQRQRPLNVYGLNDDAGCSGTVWTGDTHWLQLCSSPTESQTVADSLEKPHAHSDREHGPWCQTAGVQIPALHFISC